MVSSLLWSNVKSKEALFFMSDIKILVVAFFLILTLTTSPTVSSIQAAANPWVDSSVKLKVQSDNAHSWGTGTIIDTRDGSALVLTCGHIFRDSQGQGSVDVYLYHNGSNTAVSGFCRYYDLEMDLALVVIQPPFPVRAIPVAADDLPLPTGLQVLSVGCDHGADPTVRTHQILSTDRVGTPRENAVPFHYIQVSDAPVSGRSGGGLFSQDGFLIGVCNTADPVENDGHFVPATIIRRILKQLNLQEVADRPSLIDRSKTEMLASESTAPIASQASLEPLTASNALTSEAFASPQPTLPPPSQFLAEQSMESPQTARVPVSLEVPRTQSGSDVSPAEVIQQATLEQVRNHAQQGDEIIIIVRSKDHPEKPLDFIVLNASAEDVLGRLARVKN